MMKTTIHWFLGLLLILLVGCQDTIDSNYDVNQPLLNQMQADILAIEKSLELESTPHLASFIISDKGLTEYNSNYQLSQNSSLETQQSKNQESSFAQWIKQHKAKQKEPVFTTLPLESEPIPENDVDCENHKGLDSENDLSTQAIKYECIVTPFSFNDGAFYITQSNISEFKGVAMQNVYLPSRATGSIDVEEDNFSACPNNFTGLAETPYIMLGGMGEGNALTAQNIDAGFHWNCGTDSWDVFLLTSNGELTDTGNWRLRPDSPVLFIFYVDVYGNPTVYAHGTWHQKNVPNSDQVGTVHFACASFVCLDRGWNATGNDLAFKVEVNIAQNSRNLHSGAKFNNTVISELYLRNRIGDWNWQNWTIGPNVSSPLTLKECIIPNYGYQRYGNTNSLSGLRVNVNLN